VVLAFPRNSGQVFVTATEAGVGRTVTTWKTEQEGVRDRSGATFRRSGIKNPYEFWGGTMAGLFETGRPYFQGAIDISIFYARRDYRLVMRKASGTARQAFGGCLLESQAGPGGSMHLDVGSRPFQNRPSYGPPLWQVLRVVVFTAAAIAAVKFCWILAVYFVRG
jgi:hypothetical protein